MPKVVPPQTSFSDERSQKTLATLQKMRERSIEEEASLRAQEHGIPYIDLHIFPVNHDDLILIPEAEARRLGLALFHKKGPRVRIAMHDPSHSESLSYVKQLATERGWDVEFYVASQPSLDHAWEGYKNQTLRDSLDLMRVSLSGKDLEQFEKDFGELIALKENHATSTTRAMEILLAGARKLRASDIHCEPSDTGTRLRFRVDGVLQDMGTLPMPIYRKALSRIKMLGHMRLNIRDEAQDGHFFVDIEGQRIDVRVSIIPGNHGESINMRLLSGEDIIVDVDELGLRGLAKEIVMKEITKPHGMILNTGPTGSGKTTTLYTLINKINIPGTKIISVEDPVEYELAGAVQTEISKDSSYTFATALRAVVRQDPDILLIGEIRDAETADIAINAALTGHLVFSSLHTNNAPAAIPRFIELSVRPSLLVSAINVIIAQRLVRRLCERCKTTYVPAQETVQSLIKLITIISPKAKLSLPQKIEQLWKAVGCPHCHFTGYKGRIGIFEVFIITPEIEKIIGNLGTERDIFKAALEDGMVTMTQDGLLKSLEGTTSLEEVWRVTDQVELLKNIYEELMPSALSRGSVITQSLYENVRQAVVNINHFDAFMKRLDSRDRLPAIMAAALLLKAGDIHIEPTATTVDIRLRIDGILTTIAHFPINEYPSFLGEIKLLAGLKSGERAGITDSRFSITLETSLPDTATNKVDVRLSIILGGFGETVVLRLLNQSVVKLDFAALDLSEYNLQRILTAIEKPNGLILHAGPTGSGKTTTLYSLLQRLNTPEVKIITVEDPIEYQIPGLLQTQINESEGYTFATALRSLLRQNPDILMVGEIRDDETAKIAVQASATGHLVLSTLHANSAAGIVSRLVEMGVSGDDIANASNLFVAQRLVRRLCPHCRTVSAPTQEEEKIIESTLSSLNEKATITLPKQRLLSHPKGCDRCNGTGFSGQCIICETLVIDSDIQELISRKALVSEIEKKAIDNGMVSLIQDGVIAALLGKTTLEEVKRVTNL